MPHNDEIIQISGGMNDFIGKLDQDHHPMGENWYRIKDPCHIFFREETIEEGGKERTMVKTIVKRYIGLAGKIIYRKHVDLRIPECDPMEIRTLDKKGPLYEAYKGELEQVEPKRIIVPDFKVVPK